MMTLHGKKYTHANAIIKQNHVPKLYIAFQSTFLWFR